MKTTEDTMMITAVEVDDQTLWEGTQVRNKQSGQLRTIRFLPPDMGLYQACLAGKFNAGTDIDYETFKLNMSKFELVKDEDGIGIKID